MHVQSRIVGSLATLCLGASALAAESPNPRQFAYGMPIQGVDEEPVQTVLLPPPVYQGVVSGDLHDLRVFNGQSEQVPHAIRTLDRAEQTDERRWMALPFFPLPGDLWTAADLSVW